MAAIAASLIVIAAAIAIWRSHSAQLPVIAEVPDFRLIDSDGREVSRSDLDGKIWIADFIFTKCPGMCPMLSSEMKRVQSELAKRGDHDVRLVSFSVDPHNDTPEALQAYARRYDADPQRWLFLTGERDSLYELIGKGFMLAVVEREPEGVDDSQELITHSDRFVLVDREHRIRAYYHGTERESVDQLLSELEQLE